MKQTLSAALGILLASVACAAVPQIPIETLFGTNYIRYAVLSPDGTMVAFLAPSGDTYGIAILNLETHKVTNPIHIEDENVNSVTWKGNDRLIFSGIISGIESGPQVASTDVEGKHVFSILQAQKDKMKFSIYSGGIVSMRKQDTGHIYIYGYTLESDFKQDGGIQGAELIMKVNVVNGQRTLVAPADDGDTSSTLGGFGVDQQGRVRTAYRSKGLSSEFVYRDDTTDPWKTVRKFQAENDKWAVVGFEGDGGNGVYIIDKESSDTGALRVFDPATGTLGPALFTPVDGEIDSLVFSPDGKRLLGLRYTTEKVHFHWFEPKYASLQARLDASFPGESVALASISDDEKRILVRTYSDRELGAYYLLDLNKGSMGIVTTAGPKINREDMAPMKPISFVSRDGLTIHGYLTLPLDFVPGKPGPLIIHPHGGPFGVRDDWGFDPEVQLLANRGYAVLQVNYRGSGGYGQSFQFAGYREWGGKMQDDLTDSVKWAIEQGYADPKRVAIFGASYGGYATLAGLVFTPELYKCGINYVGVSDLVELARRKGPGDSDARINFFNICVGADHQFLYDHSPVNFVDRIRVPLLNAYGDNDPRVERTHWVELKAQLDKYHKDYEYVYERDEGHGFGHVKDAVEFYDKVEAFLKKNL